MLLLVGVLVNRSGELHVRVPKPFGEHLVVDVLAEGKTQVEHLFR